MPEKNEPLKIPPKVKYLMKKLMEIESPAEFSLGKERADYFREVVINGKVAMTVGKLIEKLQGFDSNLPIDFGCQCDSFDEWELRIHDYGKAIGLYLVKGEEDDTGHKG